MRAVLLFIYLGWAVAAGAQGAATSAIKDFPVKKILNHSSGSSSFNQLKKDLTIIDFFGTWCIPCIKALPHLKEVQEKYKNQLQVLLVSIEEEEKLKKFIAGRANFSFPLAVDADNTITALFQPPSYPYSVVVDGKGNIVATITDATELTDAAIEGWLSNRKNGENAIVTIEQKNTPVKAMQKSTNAVVQLSQEFIYAAKTGDALESLQNSLASLGYNTLKNSLGTDNEKKAFWINIYNGYTNAILKKDPEKYSNRSQFFKANQVPVAGMNLSLDEIEHDFLRRTKIKWSLGHFNKLFPSKRAKELRVNKLDYRIHFALNCGAKSCPPIAFYNPENLDQQLDVATKSYLSSEAEYDKEQNILYLPAIMSWFRADFGGKKGIKAIIKKHSIIPQAADPKIQFKKYDWTLEVNNFKTD